MDKQETRLNVAWRREGRRAKDGEDLKAARDTGRSSPRENMCICEECGWKSLLQKTQGEACCRDGKGHIHQE